jgi:hypothetical protein
MKESLIEKLLARALADEEKETPCESGSYVSPFRVGKKYFFRTATMYWTGKIDRIEGHFAVLTTAAWIADTGRFSEFASGKEANEVEPVKGEAIVNLDGVIDAIEIDFVLPANVK